MTRLHPLYRFGLGLAAASLLVAACGDDDDAGDDAGAGDDTPAETGDAPEYADDAEVILQDPPGGAEVTSPVNFRMFFQGVTLATAGEAIEGEGHMHLLLDGECEEPGTVIPSDDTHVHFGDASFEAELELEPGDYTVCLQLADGLHVASDLTDVVEFTVVE